MLITSYSTKKLLKSWAWHWLQPVMAADQDFDSFLYTWITLPIIILICKWLRWSCVTGIQLWIKVSLQVDWAFHPWKFSYGKLALLHSGSHCRWTCHQRIGRTSHWDLLKQCFSTPQLQLKSGLLFDLHGLPFMQKFHEFLVILSTLLHDFVSKARSLVATNCYYKYCHYDITMLAHVGLDMQCPS